MQYMMSGVVGHLNTSSLKIYHWACQWNNFENRSFDNDERHVTAFRPISEVARSWSRDNAIMLCKLTFGFVDGVMFEHNAANYTSHAGHATHRFWSQSLSNNCVSSWRQITCYFSLHLPLATVFFDESHAMRYCCIKETACEAPDSDLIDSFRSAVSHVDQRYYD